MEATRAATAAGFMMPPVTTDERGHTRTVGFELEYSGLSLSDSARIVQDLFNGDHVVVSTFSHEVRAPCGTFSVDIDSNVLKHRMYEEPMRLIGLEPEQLDTRRLEEVLFDVFATFAPIEIGAPPLPMDQLAPLETLRAQLRERGARGTRSAFWYAFGLHINVQVPSLDPAVLLNYLRAFALLDPWIRDHADVDAARQISPFINPFPEQYVQLVMRNEYDATATRLIDDYMLHNPTRNRPLDMLPVLCHIDAGRVARWLPPDHKTLFKPRPTFHFRLPNCRIDERDWTLAFEWNKWVIVERLANDRDRLDEMRRSYLAAKQASFKSFLDRWPELVEQYIKR